MINAPITVQLEVTEKCNYQCPHCYHLVNNVKSKPNFNFSENDKKILEITKILVKMKIFNVVLTGGEPLMKKELVLRLVRYFKIHNITVSLNTNLVLLDDKFLDKFIELKGSNILVSCPATVPKIYKKMTGNGNFQQFKNKIQKLVNNNVPFTVNMVVNKNNLFLIRKTAKKMVDLGVKRFAVTPMALNVLYPNLDSFLCKDDVKRVIYDILWIKKTFGIYVDIMEALPKCIFPKDIRNLNLNFLRRKCQAGITTMAISNNGDVRPCTHNPDVYGNILKENPLTGWKKMSDWRKGDYIPQECRKCKAINICLGGCRMTAKAYSTSRFGKDPWMTSVFLENSFRDLSHEFSLNGNSVIHFLVKFQYRKEKGGYLINTEGNNILIVNNELFRFVKYLKSVCEIKIDDLVAQNKISINDKGFQKILTLLLEKKFIILNK